MIPFNKPFCFPNALKYIQKSINAGKISGDGIFTKMCSEFFDKKYGFSNVLLTTSCTHALEMAAILIDLKPGDEVIMPSYTFVSTANAFVLRGAKIVFVDCQNNHPNIDHTLIEGLITKKTKAIVPVHYAGISCEMDKIMAIAKKYKLWVIEDAAQAICGKYKNKLLGSIGHLSAFSFHETKNVISGEGGMLVINDPKLLERAEIIREKGTNRSKYFRGQVDKYTWVDIGSSYLPSDIISAYLYSQLENLDTIQNKRVEQWNRYFKLLSPLEKRGIMLPKVPSYSANNGHIFYLICRNCNERDDLIDFLKRENIMAVFHYTSLHLSNFYLLNNNKQILPNCEKYSESLVRLPLYFDLSNEHIDFIVENIFKYFNIDKEK